MRLLAIETSCDETAVCVIDAMGGLDGATFRILGDALYSQAHLHAEYGGVFPTLAKREHIKNLPHLLDQALKESGTAPVDIDLIAVTAQPGLEPALWTGIDFAKKLGAEWGVPIVGVNHMEGHIVSALVQKDGTDYKLLPTDLPLLALLISGGHTELLLMREWFKYEVIGRTLDDAVGEAFDKVARMLGLAYPGGPKIEALTVAAVARGAQHDIVFPRPLAHDNTCNFSYSGLKTAVMYKLKTMPNLSEEDKEHVAQAFQDAARDVLVMKTKRAIEQTAAQTLAVGGGVSASKDIRRGLEAMIASDYPSMTLCYPSLGLHLDNAIMIGMAAYLRHAGGAPSFPLTALGSAHLA